MSVLRKRIDSRQPNYRKRGENSRNGSTRLDYLNLKIIYMLLIGHSYKKAILRFIPAFISFGCAIFEKCGRAIFGLE